MKNKNLAVLMTCHNRKDKTLLCLEAICRSTIPRALSISIFLVDDGCLDGTPESVNDLYPNVILIKGTGQLYWNGGMRLAWENALQSDLTFDFFLWLNDDSMIYDDSISRLVQEFESIQKKGITAGAIIGTMIDPVSKQPSYGGRLRASKINPLGKGNLIRPSAETLECDFINGNFVLIPSSSVNRIGILSDVFTHGMGDFDYGLRLKSAGLTCWVAPGVYGECSPNTLDGGCKDGKLSVSERVFRMNLINQLPPAEEWKYFVRHHGGLIWPFLWLKVHLRQVFPRLWAFLRATNK